MLSLKEMKVPFQTQFQIVYSGEPFINDPKRTKRGSKYQIGGLQNQFFFQKCDTAPF